MIRKNQHLLQLTEAMEGKTNLRNINAGQRFIHQDEQLSHVYIIKSGIAKCFITERTIKSISLSS